MATWAEIDGDTWTIPASRMKRGREHRIPLSRQAMDVLRAARELSDGTGLIFPSIRGQGHERRHDLQTGARKRDCLRAPRDEYQSFRDWAAECSDVPREIAEHALAHVEGSASELAYRRTDYFETATGIDASNGLTLSNDIYTCRHILPDFARYFRIFRAKTAQITGDWNCTHSLLTNCLHF